MLFGFVSGEGTSDTLFVVRRMQEECRDEKKELCITFVDIKKAFDEVPGVVVRWATQKKLLSEVIVGL